MPVTAEAEKSPVESKTDLAEVLTIVVTRVADKPRMIAQVPAGEFTPEQVLQFLMSNHARYHLQPVSWRCSSERSTFPPVGILVFNGKVGSDWVK